MLIDCEDKVDVFDLPCCPFCDTIVQVTEFYCLCEAKGGVFVAHTVCLHNKNLGHFNDLMSQLAGVV